MIYAFNVKLDELDKNSFVSWMLEKYHSKFIYKKNLIWQAFSKVLISYYIH